MTLQVKYKKDKQLLLLFLRKVEYDVAYSSPKGCTMPKACKRKKKYQEERKIPKKRVGQIGI